MKEETKWITKNGVHIPITNNYMNDFIRDSQKKDNLMKIEQNKKIYRAYNENNKSKDFDKTGYFYDDDKELVLENYGENLDTKSFDKNSKIYEKEKSSWDYVHKNNLLNKKYEFLKNLKSRFYGIENDKKVDTLQELFDDIENKGYGYYDEENDIYNYTDMGLYATQMVAKYELEKQGYDGVHWRYEEDNDPLQYQIWNEKILK